LNPGRRGGKQETNSLSYGAASLDVNGLHMKFGILLAAITVFLDVKPCSLVAVVLVEHSASICKVWDLFIC
jgi:hypothetical protein